MHELISFKYISSFENWTNMSYILKFHVFKRHISLIKWGMNPLAVFWYFDTFGFSASHL